MADEAMTPEAFAGFCGPTALAAVLSTSTRFRLRTACARDLLAVQAERGSFEAPGTSVETMTLALDRHGFTVEPFDPAPTRAMPLATAAAFLADCRRAIPKVSTSVGAVRAFIESAPVDEQPKLWAKHLNRNAHHARMRAWLRQPGTWLFVASGEENHWIAARDGVVIAGDDAQASVWSERHLQNALRVRRCG